jgi:hypothetical protein
LTACSTSPRAADQAKDDPIVGTWTEIEDIESFLKSIRKDAPDMTPADEQTIRKAFPEFRKSKIIEVLADGTLRQVFDFSRAVEVAATIMRLDTLKVTDAQVAEMKKTPPDTKTGKWEKVGDKYTVTLGKTIRYVVIKDGDLVFQNEKGETVSRVERLKE